MSRDPESILRDVFADRAGGVVPPTGVYAAVRRRHRRRQQALVGGTVAVTVAAVGVPAVLLDGRIGAAPTATPSSADVQGCATTPTAVRGLPAQHDVRGSLGGDAKTVAAAGRAAWSALSSPDSGGDHGLDPGTVRVHSVERADGGLIVAVATGTAGTTELETVVGGPDRDHLGPGGFTSGGAVLAGEPFASGREFFVGQLLQVCGRSVNLIAVVAPPGSAAQLSHDTAVDADGHPVRHTVPVPLRADGTAVFARPALPRTIVRVQDAGGTSYTHAVDGPPIPALLSTADRLRAVAAAPGDGVRAEVTTLSDSQPDAVPFTQTGIRVLWSARLGDGRTLAAFATTLPSGAQYVWGGASPPGRGADESFGGYLAAGALPGTALTWQVPGGPLVVIVPGTKTVTAGGTTSTVTAGVLAPSGSSAAGVRVTDAAGKPVPVRDVRTLTKV
ncbi:MAG TPA: hypothetical protein VGP36_18305 [Mycobacteriales bacterium]|jgi:hypothetical protein|nr:hypothetical protein [Mycobacteriales bacterium]